MTNAEAWFSIALRPARKPEGSLGRTAQDGHLDSHTAPELYDDDDDDHFYIALFSALEQTQTHFKLNSIIIDYLWRPIT